MSDTKYLFRRDQIWWVKIAVPRTLRDKLGYDLRRSLRTTDLEVAREKRDAVVEEFRNTIKEARAEQEQSAASQERQQAGGTSDMSAAPGPGFEIVRQEDFSDVTNPLEIQHPTLAQAARPGQFVDMLDKHGERIPLTIADVDVDKGTITLMQRQQQKKTALPDTSGFFEIRFESIGGLGAHAAGQILARTAVLNMNLNGAHFSSYGSEKKGSVVKSFVRLGPPDKPIRTSAPIDSPDVIVVFHAALLDHPATLAGMKESGTVIFNASSGEVPKALERLSKNVKVVRVDALKIAMEEKSRPNAVLLGTLTAVLPFLDQAAVSAGIAEGFAHHAEAVASNERAFRRGAEEFRCIKHVGKGKGDLPIIRPAPVWGFDTAPLGGVLPNAGNTVWNDLTTSRTGWIPVFNADECIHCGMCVMVCPDYCLVWAREEIEQPDGEVVECPRLQGVDYQYCKGCMRCIETCPTEALHREAEEPGLAERLGVPLFPELVELQRGRGK